MMYKISMFRIKEVEQKIKVPCEFCFSKGIVYNKCSKCGGNGAFYGWVREDDNKRVDDRDLKGLKFKTIKERYK